MKKAKGKKAHKPHLSPTQTCRYDTYIISDTGKIADVSPFMPDYKSMEIPIVDAAIQYEDPYDGKEYILVIRNALYVPSMKNNLPPPFILCQAGI